MPRFQREVAQLHEPGWLIIDLDELEFIDAGGLRAIVEIARKAERAGRTVQVANASTTLRRLFTITGLERSVTLVSDDSPAA